ncbi:hypothetical protein LIER_31022 [Lithospermum erythrorhizon]|uniref:Uncharacterized protein n=1 Tax=Lithospermum erythrorhizon TaxID=34254 RepID=A0AAV3RSV3_LITER
MEGNAHAILQGHNEDGRECACACPFSSYKPSHYHPRRNVESGHKCPCFPQKGHCRSDRCPPALLWAEGGSEKALLLQKESKMRVPSIKRHCRDKLRLGTPHQGFEGGI